MTAVHVDSPVTDDDRRARLYRGDVFAYGERPSITAFVGFARGLVEEAFADLDPRTAQHHLPVEAYVALLSELKPRFIHHPDAKAHIRAVLDDLGCDTSQTYFDVPRLRTATADEYLTSGIAYAYHAHRDTWYSAPPMQVNWWLPVYPVAADNVMAFHPRYFDRTVANSSAAYNYYTWNRTSRREAPRHVTRDTRPQPHAEEEIELEPSLRFVPPVGGLVMFSGAHLHSSVRNTSGVTRFSIDFRTVHVGDVRDRRGAPTEDSHCTGTTLRDFLRADDHQPLPGALVDAYDSDRPPDEDDLVFRP